ncbi:uncharacterized protein PpBr36_10304 [Pyricularia pennisetigena]|uniref:uncharacterized protein n=1 Tax=Pyricularia pennisetigena TaxID=1578925 RepID=UPI00114E10A4|nr:uncharacterized protein PpBr36_10304 [Pyricularia pennisetigena]TLS21291.1 hypothetical protein PpBr36_10304 [Pyricularia pennisetigena]
MSNLNRVLLFLLCAGHNVLAAPLAHPGAPLATDLSSQLQPDFRVDAAGSERASAVFRLARRAGTSDKVPKQRQNTAEKEDASTSASAPTPAGQVGRSKKDKKPTKQRPSALAVWMSGNSSGYKKYPSLADASDARKNGQSLKDQFGHGVMSSGSYKPGQKQKAQSLEPVRGNDEEILEQQGRSDKSGGKRKQTQRQKDSEAAS